MIKRLFFPVFIFLFILTSCSSIKGTKIASESIVGTWEFESLTLSDTTNCAEISNIFENSVLNFDENKKFKFKVADFEKTGEWTIGKNGKLLVLGFDNTQNTSNRLKSFILNDLNNEFLCLKFTFDNKDIILKYKKD